MSAMEKLAVLRVHKAIHTMNMWKMAQQSDESIRAFSARITGTAELCGMNVKCSCGIENSDRDKAVTLAPLSSSLAGTPKCSNSAVMPGNPQEMSSPSCWILQVMFCGFQCSFLICSFSRLSPSKGSANSKSSSYQMLMMMLRMAPPPASCVTRRFSLLSMVLQ